MRKTDFRGIFSSAFLALLTGVGASFLFAALALLLSGNVGAETHQSAHSGLIHVRTADGRVMRNVPRLDTRVRIAVSGMLARVKVEQRFLNPSEEWVEALYVFPLPEDSAVDHMRMQVGDRVVEGEIQERSQARATYERARQSGRHASLLEQQRPNMFTSSVANVPPGEEIAVQIEYQQAVHLDDGLFSLRFPMVVGPRYIPGNPLAAQAIEEQTPSFDGHGWAAGTDQVPDAAHITPPVIADGEAYENPVTLEILLNAGMKLEHMHSLYHAIETVELGEGQHLVTLTDGQVPADRDFVLEWRLAVGSQPKAALFAENWRDRHYSLLMVMPPSLRSLDQGQLSPRELILVVDTSGSMHGGSIEQARSALRVALGQLRPQDRFNLIQFNDRFQALYPKPVSVDREHLQEALRFVDGLEADGGTEMEPAMRYALARQGDIQRLRQVVFLTDGDIGNEQALFSTIDEHLGDARLFPVGIGAAPNSYFMTHAARFGRGSYTFIGDLAEVEQKMLALFERLAAPVLTDIEVQWQGGAESPVELCEGKGSSRPADVYAGEPLLLTLCAEQVPQSATIQGRWGTRLWRREIGLQGGANATGIHVLWAREKIADWMAQRSLGEDSERVRSKVVSLALEHHLVSAYTSLVAVDKTPSRPQEEALHSKPVPTLLPKGWSSSRVFGMLPQTATSAPLYLLLGTVIVLFSLLGMRWGKAR